MIRLIRLMAVISFIVMWSSTVVLADGMQKAAADDKYSYEQIYISLPVYIISLLATAGFVWAVAKYDNKRAQEMRALRDEIRASCRFPGGCDECPFKDTCKIKNKNEVKK